MVHPQHRKPQGFQELKRLLYPHVTVNCHVYYSYLPVHQVLEEHYCECEYPREMPGGVLTHSSLGRPRTGCERITGWPAEAGLGPPGDHPY